METVACKAVVVNQITHRKVRMRPARGKTVCALVTTDFNAIPTPSTSGASMGRLMVDARIDTYKRSG